MGIIQKEWEKIQEEKILDLLYNYNQKYYELRPLKQTENEEYYIADNNAHFVYSNISKSWTVLL